MVRDLNKEKTEIRNGNRFVTEVKGTGVFPRDVDRLFLQYANLRNKVYNVNKDLFFDEATRKELRSYIDEQFVKLTKEYHINGEVDFAGYIKKSLNLRVRHSFVKSRFRDNSRERLGSEDDEIELLLSASEANPTEIEDAELIDSLLTDASFSPLELEVFTLMVQGKVKEKEISRLITAEDVSQKAIREAIRNVKDYLILKLN